MKALIDIGHPAHVHLFKHFAHEMINKGHRVYFTCRDRKHIITLLNHEGFQFICFGKNYKTASGKLWGLFYFTWKLYLVIRKIKPDIFLSHSSMYAAFVAFLTGKPHISFEDTFNFEQIRLYKPFTKAILTGDYPHPLNSNKVIRYSGYHELAYLHPNRFTPDKSILRELGVKSGEKYVIMRFVSWHASHDIGQKGISTENKLKAIKAFSKFGKVFISSEGELPKELQKYQIKIKPWKMHGALAGASLLFSESATMASEAAVLGTPALFLDNIGRLYTKELEDKYLLCFNYSQSENDIQKAIQKGVELLQSEGIKEQWQKKRDAMLRDKIDVTAFLIWFIENWPESFKIMKEKSDYQDNFR